MTMRIPFGKYRDQKLDDVAISDPGYLNWMLMASAQGTFTHPWPEDNADAIRESLSGAAKRKAAQVRASLTLTDHQTEVAGALISAIFAGEQITHLSGGAGYGKSYVTAQVAIDLINAGYKVRATAVSYVATQVLAAQLDPCGVECATLARTLRFQKEFVEGQEIYSLSPDSPDYAREALSEGCALIVDECSMISNDIALFLFDTVKQYGGRLVLVGDGAQLPPVKQDTLSICCTQPTTIETLKIPMRYSADCDLYGVEQAARNNPWDLMRALDFDAYAGSDMVSVYSGMDGVVERYVSNYRADPRALHRMLLFRRADVVSANNSIREALFGADAPLVVEDERLMILATTDFPFGVPREQSTRLYSGQSFSVTETREMTGADAYQIVIGGDVFHIPHYTVRLHDCATSRPVRVIFSVTENTADQGKLGGPEFQAALSAARAFATAEDEFGNVTGSWAPYRQLLGDFVRVAYQYATSVHRAQGQTTDYAYAAPRGLLAVPGIMGRSLAYVALTRARKQSGAVTLTAR